MQVLERTMPFGKSENLPFDMYVMDGEGHHELGVKDAINAEWLDFRNKGIGGSDVAAIMGISKYRSPVEVWMEKRGLKEPQDLSDKEAVEWGNRLESIVRDKFAETHPELMVMELPASLVSHNRPWAHANLDGCVKDEHGEWGVLEIKTVGKNREKDWADGVPDYYLTQVTHYLSVTGWKYAWVVALIGGQHYVEFKVMRDEDDVAMVESAVDTFWNDCVVGGALPQIVGGSTESGALLDLFGVESSEYVQPENVNHFDTLVHDYQEAKACEKKYAEQAKRIANDIRAMVGSAKGAVSDVYKVTWVKSASTRFDSKRFAAEHPNMAQGYMVSSLADRGLRVSEVKR